MRPSGQSNIEADYEGVREPVLLDFEKLYPIQEKEGI